MFENPDLFYSILPDYATRMGAALVCGVALGLERERKDKPAGIRTIVLITVGSTVYMLLSHLMPALTEGPEAITRVDSARIAAQVVTGVGFLGAGTVIQARGSVHGLTTAAVIWVAAAIGLLAGAGFPLLAGATTLLVLLALIGLDPIAERIPGKGTRRTLTLRAPNDVLVAQRIAATLRKNGIADEDVSMSVEPDGSLTFSFDYHDSSSSQGMLRSLSMIGGVHGDRLVKPT